MSENNRVIVSAISAIKANQKERDKIAKQMQEYLDKGNEIDYLKSDDMQKGTSTMREVSDKGRPDKRGGE